MKAETRYPEAFLQHMRKLLGEEFDEFMHSLEDSSPVSLRLNPYKRISRFDVEEPVPWCAEGRYLAARPSFTFDPLFHAGSYYVQEASSMFIEHIWNQITPPANVKVLDMCAAPGGKSTHLLSLMKEESLLVSNEIIPGRNNILQQNIMKWGTANCVVTQNKADDFSKLEGYFDVLLLDAPCSGEGLFRKDKDAIDEWSEKNVELCALRQHEILKQAAMCLKAGGFLIYSTCTFEEVENDKQVADCGLKIADIELPSLGQTKTKYGYQFFPHRAKGEGFYIAVLQKGSAKETPSLQDEKPKTLKHKPQTLSHLQNPQQYIEHSKNDMLFAFPKSMYSDFLFLEKHLYIRHAGIYMGTVKGKDFLPSHDLAMSIHVRKDLPSVDLSLEDAISYLRGGTPRLATDIRGWCLATYQNMNIGWMKVLDGRINNYYPKELRILKQA